MATLYGGGVVCGKPELQTLRDGGQKFVALVREAREYNGKVYTEELTVEAYRELAAELHTRVMEGATVKVKGYPRTMSWVDAQGKPQGRIVVKVVKPEGCEVTEYPQGAPAARPAQAAQVADEDPFGDQ